MKVSTTKIEVTPELLLNLLAGLNDLVQELGEKVLALDAKLERLDVKPERRWEPNDGE